MDIRVWVHNDQTDGVKPVEGQIERRGNFAHLTFAGLHIAVSIDDLEDMIDQGDDGK